MRDYETRPERAEAMVLQLSDFPTGWRGSAPEEADREGFRTCVGTDLSGFTKIGEAESQDFATGDSTSASSEAIVYTDEEQAEWDEFDLCEVSKITIRYNKKSGETSAVTE